MPKSTRSAGWTWTLNNYTDEDITKLQALNIKYICYGKETAPTTGTPHLQGYLLHEKRVVLDTIIKLVDIPRIHFIPSKGSKQQNIVYCKKDGDFWQNREPGQPGRYGITPKGPLRGPMG